MGGHNSKAKSSNMSCIKKGRYIYFYIIPQTEMNDTYESFFTLFHMIRRCCKKKKKLLALSTNIKTSQTSFNFTQFLLDIVLTRAV